MSLDKAPSFFFSLINFPVSSANSSIFFRSRSHRFFNSASVIGLSKGFSKNSILSLHLSSHSFTIGTVAALSELFVSDEAAVPFLSSDPVSVLLLVRVEEGAPLVSSVGGAGDEALSCATGGT